METLIKDLQFALRGLLKRPAFTAIAIATLALGIGANTAMPIIKGRTFESSDTQTSLPVAIVDEKLAQMYSTQGDLVGKRIRIGGGPWLTIVGVVPNVKNRKPDEDAWPYIYRPFSQWTRRETMVVMRTAVNPRYE